MMNSELKVESVYGKGSTFYFKILQKIIDKKPVGDFKNQSIKRSKEHTETKTYLNAAGAKILVVDDNSMNLKVIYGILKFNLVKPDLVESGAQCLELLTQNKYDIIFLDHMMPVMDGIETLKKIKADHLADGTVIIALTANAISGAKEMYLQSGFDDYLSKPVNPKDLEVILKKYLPKDLASRKEVKPVEEIVKAEEIPTVEKVEEKVEVKENVEKVEETVEIEENAEVEEASEDSFSSAEKELLEKICPEINLETAMGYCMDSKEIFTEMMGEFFSGDKTEQVDNLYTAEDWKNYRIQVHALKSTSLVIGAENFSAKAKAQEFAAKDERIDELKNNHSEFIISYKKLLKEIGNWLKETGNAKNIDS
jgi:CheY-like chemotaxis protein